MQNTLVPRLAKNRRIVSENVLFVPITFSSIISKDTDRKKQSCLGEFQKKVGRKYGGFGTVIILAIWFTAHKAFSLGKCINKPALFKSLQGFLDFHWNRKVLRTDTRMREWDTSLRSQHNKRQKEKEHGKSLSRDMCLLFWQLEERRLQEQILGL